MQPPGQAETARAADSPVGMEPAQARADEADAVADSATDRTERDAGRAGNVDERGHAPADAGQPDDRIAGIADRSGEPGPGGVTETGNRGATSAPADDGDG